MKMILFASALALSTAAIAQDTAPTPPAADPSMQAAPAAPAAPATPDAAAPAMPDATAPATPATPDAAAPAAPAAAPAATADDSNLPACTKSVTDKCVQKGGKASSHHAMKKHAKK